MTNLEKEAIKAHLYALARRLDSSEVLRVAVLHLECGEDVGPVVCALLTELEKEHKHLFDLVNKLTLIQQRKAGS